MSTAPRWLRAGVALLILTGMAFVLAHAALDRYLRAEAGVALDRIGRGESRFAFEFERTRDLISKLPRAYARTASNKASGARRCPTDAPTCA